MLLAAYALVSCGGEKPVPEPVTPGTPTGVMLYGSTDASLTFQWTAVNGADGYNWRLMQGSTRVKDGSVTIRNVTIPDLEAGTSYRFSVQAYNGAGESAFSTELEASTTGGDDPVIPDPPTPPSGGLSYEEYGIPAAEEDGVARAFPGAEGGGMYTTGGRGGKVYHVTSLKDDGSEGTLRHAIRQKGARTIVFDVAGIIELQDKLEIHNGDLTIAGQTAPGDGICIKNYSTVIKEGADNVIIRFIRFRLGDEAPWSEADIKAGKADSEDAIWGRYLHDIILDHCSMSWSIDETASFYANECFTMQWCTVAESMRNCRLHSKGAHGYGGIWGGRNASFHHNLLAHHQNRTPRFDHQYLYDGNGKSTDEFRGNVDYRNCVNYNWGSSNGCYGGEGGHFNMVGNYYRKGPDSNDKKYFIEADGGYKTDGKTYPYDWAYLYLSDNYNNEYPNGDSSYPDGVYWKKAYDGYGLSYDGHILTSPLPLSGKGGLPAFTTTHSTSDARDRVCDWAGASLSKDAVDSRIAADVKAGTGRLIDDMDEVQAAYGIKWPEYGAGKEELAAAADGDGDGIPDAWEAKMGLDAADASDGAAKGIDPAGRYTNLEMYLHLLVKDVVAAGNSGGTYTEM